MIPLGTERNMGDANDGNRTRVFCLAGIDHSKGRGCRVMFPEVVGQFTVKYTVKGPIRRYSDTMYCMFTDVACFNSHKKTNALHSIFVCVCVCRLRRSYWEKLVEAACCSTGGTQ